MTIEIRKADLVRDRKALIEMAIEHLAPVCGDARYEWLYLKNPHGLAWAWVAVQSSNDMIVGMAAAFPRRLMVGGSEVKAWVLGDFCLREESRSLGPALQLQRACLAAIDSGDVDCCYDFPSKSMMAVYRRLRIPQTDDLVRLAKPLRVDRKVRALVNIGWVTSGMSALGNLVLRVKDGWPSSPSDVVIAPHQSSCGDEFTAFAARHRGKGDEAQVDRCAHYLNWRYLTNPIMRHELMTARTRQGLLVGFVVYAQTGDDAVLVDLCSDDDRRVQRGLIQSVVSRLRDRGVVTLSAPLATSHPWKKILHDLGFRDREKSPVVVYWSPRLRMEQAVPTNIQWSFVSGDRDS